MNRNKGDIDGFTIFILLLGLSLAWSLIKGAGEIIDERNNGKWDFTFRQLDPNSMEVKIEIEIARGMNPIKGGQWVESSTDKWTIPIRVVVGDPAASKADVSDPNTGLFYLDFERINAKRQGLCFDRVLNAKAERLKTGEAWREYRKGGRTIREEPHWDIFGYRIEMSLLCTLTQPTGRIRTEKVAEEVVREHDKQLEEQVPQEEDNDNKKSSDIVEGLGGLLGGRDDR